VDPFATFAPPNPAPSTNPFQTPLPQLQTPTAPRQHPGGGANIFSPPPAGAGRGDVGDFLEAAVYASPLTRAVQTALLALHDHPSVAKWGMKLLQSAREVKANLGGLDSVGKYTGARIHEKAVEMIKGSTVVRAGEYDAAPLERVGMDSRDVTNDWWTSERDMDSEADLEERMRDFMASVMLGPARTVIVVGHSLFLVALCRRFLGTGYLEHEAVLSKSDLREKKMSNAGCMCLDLKYSDYEVEITRANFMFGSEFKS